MIMIARSERRAD